MRHSIKSYITTLAAAMIYATATAAELYVGVMGTNGVRSALKPDGSDIVTRDESIDIAKGVVQDAKIQRIYNAVGTDALDDKGQLFKSSMSGNHWTENGRTYYYIEKSIWQNWYNGQSVTAYKYAQNPSGGGWDIAYIKELGWLRYSSGSNAATELPTGKNLDEGDEIEGTYNGFTFTRLETRMETTPYARFALESTPTAWAANTAYNVGVCASSGGRAYRCKTEHTSGSTFDASKWDEISVLAQKQDTISDLATIRSGAAAGATAAQPADFKLDTPTTWVMNPTSVEVSGQTVALEQPYWNDSTEAPYTAVGWQIQDPFLDLPVFCSSDRNAVVLTTTLTDGTAVTATRKGYQLGSDANHILAAQQDMDAKADKTAVQESLDNKLNKSGNQTYSGNLAINDGDLTIYNQHKIEVTASQSRDARVGGGSSIGIGASSVNIYYDKITVGPVSATPMTYGNGQIEHLGKTISFPDKDGKFVVDKDIEHMVTNYVDNLNGYSAVVIGTLTNGTLGVRSLTQGYENIAAGDDSHAEGGQNLTRAWASHAEGVWNVATNVAAHAEGRRTAAGAWASHSEGTDTLALGEAAHAEGEWTGAVGKGSHAEGTVTAALGHYTHTEGLGTIAGIRNDESSFYAHAEGSQTKALGLASHAEGSSTETSAQTGIAAHAEGVQTIAAAPGSHAEGFGLDAELAPGVTNHFGTAGGFFSHVSGMASVAKGLGSLVMGFDAWDTHPMLDPTNAAGVFVWQGYHGRPPTNDELTFYFMNQTNAVTQAFFAQAFADNPPYCGHGPGTFNVNPVGGTDGFWIGETNLTTYLQSTRATRSMPLVGRTYDLDTTDGMKKALKDIIEALGGTVVSPQK